MNEYSGQQKKLLECNAIKNFILEFNRTHIKKILLKELIERHGIPDTHCYLNGNDLWVEVVHSYGTNIEAAVRLDNRNISDYPEKIQKKHRIIPVNIRAINSLNQRLFDKSKKNYIVQPVWLLVRNGFTLWGKRDYINNRTSIIIPPRHPFQKIWLLCDQHSIGAPGIIRLA